MKKKSTTSNIIPTVGMGTTTSVGSDRYPGTIIQVSQNGRRVVIQEDTAIRIDTNGMSDSQEYKYEANPNGEISIATKRKDGRYRLTGSKTPVSIGVRRKYYDFSF